MECLKMRAGLFITQFQSAEVAEPRKCAFNNVTRFSQATAVSSAATGRQLGENAARLGLSNIVFRTVGAVALEEKRLSPRLSPHISQSWQAIQQGNGNRIVVDVRRRHFYEQRNPVCICDQMTFAPTFSSVGWVGSGMHPPKTARTEALSMTARVQSIRADSPSALSNRRWTCGQIPRFVHSCNRRQHVTPLPQPNSSGTNRHGEPVLSTNTIPNRQFRSGTRGRPPFGFGCSRGSNGRTSFQSSSGTSAYAMGLAPYPAPHGNLLVNLADQLKRF